MQKKPSSHFLHFTRKERRGIFFLLFVILVCSSFPFIYGLFYKEQVMAPAELRKELAALQSLQTDSSSFRESAYHNNNRQHYTFTSHESENRIQATLFYFDPNTLGEQGWLQLGLPPKTVKTVLNYLGKGGRFREAKDLYKIWGMQEADARRLIPYVRIETTVKPAIPAQVPERTYLREKRIIQPVNINTADSTAWDALPGIGGKLSVRIINFREKLGGFYAVEQVAETFGLPDSTFQLIKTSLFLDKSDLRKININTATADEMKAHPYIRYALANAIVQYRKQHGNFRQPADIRNIELVTDELFNKLAPYIVTE